MPEEQRPSQEEAKVTAGASVEGKVVFAQVEPTTRCNYICGFCSGRQMDQSDIAVEDFTRLLDTFPDLEHIELQGEGEPLLHKGFFEMARQARSRGVQLSMITNGSLLSPARVDAILDVGFEAINVSVESPDEAEFRKIRGGSFRKVRQGIARLLQARRERGLETPMVGFAITVLKHTVDRLPEIAEVYEELGMDGGVTLQPLNQMANYQEVYGPEIAEQLMDRADTERLWALVAANAKVSAMLAAAQNSRHFYPALSRRFATWHGCPWVKGALYVDRHGGITSCCMVKDSAADGLGKLGLTPVEAVLAKRQEIDAALAAGHPPAQCAGCGYYRAPEARKALQEQLLRRRAAAKPE